MRTATDLLDGLVVPEAERACRRRHNPIRVPLGEKVAVRRSLTRSDCVVWRRQHRRRIITSLPGVRLITGKTTLIAHLGYTTEARRRQRAPVGDPGASPVTPVKNPGQVAAVKRTGTTPATTKAGNTVDPDYERRLTAEAEAGFDPATLARRPVGRPSLSGRAGHSNRVDLRVDDETYQAIQRIADQGNRKVSDVVVTPSADISKPADRSRRV